MWRLIVGFETFQINHDCRTDPLTQANVFLFIQKGLKRLWAYRGKSHDSSVRLWPFCKQWRTFDRTRSTQIEFRRSLRNSVLRRWKKLEGHSMLATTTTLAAHSGEHLAWPKLIIGTLHALFVHFYRRCTIVSSYIYRTLYTNWKSIENYECSRKRKNFLSNNVSEGSSRYSQTDYFEVIAHLIYKDLPSIKRQIILWMTVKSN